MRGVSPIASASTAVLALAACGRLRFDDSLDATVADASCTSGVWSTPIQLTALSTAIDDWEPALSPDGRVLAFVRGNGSTTNDLYVSFRDSAGEFSTATILSNLNSGTDEDGPTWNASGTELWFSSARVGGTHHLFVSAFDGATFSSPVQVGAGLIGEQIIAPALSPDGTELIYTKDDTVNIGLFRAINMSGSWGLTGEVLELNTAGEDGWPSFSADGLTLYFERSVGADVDVYVATRPQLTAPFENAMPVANVADPASTEGDPYVSADGRTLLFTSQRGGAGDANIWQSTRCN